MYNSQRPEFMGAYLDYLAKLNDPKLDPKSKSKPIYRRKVKTIYNKSGNNNNINQTHGVYEPIRNKSWSNNNRKQTDSQIIHETDTSIVIQVEPLILKQECINGQSCNRAEESIYIDPKESINEPKTLEHCETVFETINDETSQLEECIVTPDNNEENCNVNDNDLIELIVISDGASYEQSLIEVEPLHSVALLEVNGEDFIVPENDMITLNLNKELNVPVIEKCPSNRWNRGVFNKIFCAVPERKDEIFFHYCRMLPHQFNFIYSWVNRTLWAMNPGKMYREDFTHPEVELAITLSFLTQGYSYEKLSSDFCLDYDTISDIVPKVCTAICSNMEPVYLPQKTDKDWLKIADDFWTKFRFPHTVGVFQAKLLHNSTWTHSVMMLLCCDANHNFVWAHFSKTDSVPVKSCAFLEKLRETVHALPQITANTLLNMPHFIVGNDSMPIVAPLMVPYNHEDSNLTSRQIIFNDRLLRINKVMEKSFDLLVNRFRLFNQDFGCPLTTIMAAMKASISLHNYLRWSEADLPCPVVVESKLETVCWTVANDQLSRAGIKNRDLIAQFVEIQRNEVILIDDDDPDVIIIE